MFRQPQPIPKIPAQRGRLRGPLALGLAVAFSCAAPLNAADRPSVPSPDDEATNTAGDAAKQCTWACLKWTKLCNVDPRGVYKCRRACADFGEVCE
ncbi:MAG: hypothetical protein QF609_02520 [Gammaproteobacteria bacterium]|jgi:hypothetical protein|nr:hypothetical protein [Gammaproteobacteria bacterium]